LKTYVTRDAEKYYENEKNAFMYLRTTGRPDPSLIGFYGSYVHDGTFNIILEYAKEGTLEDYFQNISPPSSGQDITKLWDGLLRLIGALSRIHEVVSAEEDGEIFQG